MAGTVTANLTPISMCDATTGWTIETTPSCSGNPTVSPDIYREGVQALWSYNASSANRGARYDLGAGGTDLSNQTIYCWFAFSKKENIPVLGSTGLRIRVVDTSGNYSEWYIAGSDTLPHGGWIAYAVNIEATPSYTSGTLVKTAVRYVGWVCNSVASKTYIYYDAWRYGTGLSIKGGTSGAPISLVDLYNSEAAGAYGVIDRVFGVYYIQGVINIGSTTAGDATYFQDNSQAIVFKDAKVPNGVYEIKLQGNGTANTEVYFGTLSGGRGIAGCLFRCESASQTPKYKITATDTNVTKFGFYACTMLNANTIAGQAYNANKKFIDCSVISSAAMEPGTGLVQYCNFVSATGSAIKLASISHYTSDCNFISCADGVECTAAGDAYPFDALMFTGCTYDVKNSSAGAVYIDPTGGSNVSTYENTGGGTTTINYVQITLTISGIVDGSDVVIYEAGTTTVIEDAQENSGTTYDYIYPSGDAGDNIDIGLFKAGYRPYYVRTYTLLATDSSVPVAQLVDRDYLV